MAQYNDTLENLRGAVARARPGVDTTLIDTFLNYRMRQVIDARPYWSGLITRGVLNTPVSQGIATATMTQGSNLITAIGTTWPVSDVVNTTTTGAITNLGYQTVTPASMANITTDTLLYVDATGTPEVVAVNEITPSSFKANFQFVHNPASTLTTSSLSYQQWRVGYQFPQLYTITAVLNATTLLLDVPWAGATLTSGATISRILYTFAPDLKDFIYVVDPQNATDLQIHYPLNQIAWDDPQLSANDWPQYVVDHSQNLNGNMQWMLWPPPTSGRQIYFAYIRQWPQMVARTDKPPSFLNPAIFVYGAIADCLKVTLPGEQARNNLNLNAANMWEQRFQMELLAAMQADAGKSQQAYTWSKGGGGLPGGNNFWQSHDPDVWSGNY